MSVLAIDTSSRLRTVVVIATDDGVVQRAAVRTDVAVSTALPQAIAELLRTDVSAVVVVNGPGSYTGLRAGMAAALGVARARGMPLFVTGTLDVVAAGRAQPGLSRAWAAADAGRGAMYVAACEVHGEEVRLGDPKRVRQGEFDPQGSIVLSADPLPGVIVIDPALALARAVPRALQGQAVPPDRLRAVYVE